ncbi:MAG: cyanophycin synthetase [Patescibacteria group bacterium]
MKRNRAVTGLGQIFQKIAPKIGARIIMEPNWGIVGQIIFSNGQKRYFRYSSIDINPLGASEISKDKDYASFFMKKMGYPIITGESFFSSNWSRALKSSKNINAAYLYAKKIGFPVMVKPNSGSQGTNVTLVDNKQEFYSALQKIFITDNIALVQKIVTGKDYRIVVLDKKIISVYQRLPFNIVGDGTSTARQLIRDKLERLIALDRPAKIKADDPRLIQNLKKNKLSEQSILPKGEKIILLNNANLSTGGDAYDVTKKIHPEFKKLAVNLTRDMGLRLGGVDLMVEGDISDRPKKYWVIEINAAPGLDHYIKTGSSQEKIVENMYLKILKAMQKQY